MFSLFVTFFSFPFSPSQRQLFRNLPWFETTILKPIYDNGFRFESDQHIAEFRAPVMIMHAENDQVIPYELGYQLYRSALKMRGMSWGPAEFHRFEGKYGHKFIVKATNFADTIDQFIRRYKNETYWGNLWNSTWLHDFLISPPLPLMDEVVTSNWWIIYSIYTNFHKALSPPLNSFAFRCELDLICNLPHHLLQYTARHFSCVASDVNWDQSWISLSSLSPSSFVKIYSLSSHFLAGLEFPSINKFEIFSDKRNKKSSQQGKKSQN